MNISDQKLKKNLVNEWSLYRGAGFFGVPRVDRALRWIPSPSPPPSSTEVSCVWIVSGATQSEIWRPQELRKRSVKGRRQRTADRMWDKDASAFRNNSFARTKTSFRLQVFPETNDAIHQWNYWSRQARSRLLHRLTSEQCAGFDRRYLTIKQRMVSVAFQILTGEHKKTTRYSEATWLKLPSIPSSTLYTLFHPPPPIMLRRNNVRKRSVKNEIRSVRKTSKKPQTRDWWSASISRYVESLFAFTRELYP